MRADILRPVDVKFGMTGIGLPSKILYFKHTLRANKKKKERNMTRERIRERERGQKNLQF